MNIEFNQIVGSNKTLNLQVASQIAVKILSGGLAENSIIPGEMKLCEQLGVSRTALREAIKLLSSKGLLDSRPKVGTRVCPRTNWNFLDPQLLVWLSETSVNEEIYKQFNEIRHTVEPEAAQMAALRATTGSIEDITVAYDALQRLSHSYGTNAWDKGDWNEACARFHRAIYQSTGNCFYAPFSNLITTMFNWYEGFANPSKGLHMEEYESLFSAIIEKSPEKAKTASKALLAASPSAKQTPTSLAAV